MTGIKEEQILSGMQFLLPKLAFSPAGVEDVATGMPASGDDGGNAGAVALVPSFFYVRPLSDRALIAIVGGTLRYRF